MAFRGYLALDGLEIANSSRVAAHLGTAPPTDDAQVFDTGGGGGGLIGTGGLYDIPPGSHSAGDGLYTLPPGARRYSSGLYEFTGAPWAEAPLCGACHHPGVVYDDTWPGLQAFLHDGIYRPELAPWYQINAPESGEFGGVWVLDITGLGPTPVQRPVTELVGSGGVAGPHRDHSRTITITALLIACSNAGLEYGLEWLTCRLRETNDRTDATLRYLAAHPSHSGVDPEELLRDMHKVVLTQEPRVVQARSAGWQQHEQATIYQVRWEMVALSPYAYRPSTIIPAVWSAVVDQPITWAHGPYCTNPDWCTEIPVLFSTDCDVTTLDEVSRPPPTCGGCLPVCSVRSRIFVLPRARQPFACRATAMTLIITNTGYESLTLQAYWRRCDDPVICDDRQYPLQVSGLHGGASLLLDGIDGKTYAVYGGDTRRPAGIVGTPNGAPWRPAVIDRHLCWELVAVAAEDATFDVTVITTDRDA